MTLRLNLESRAIDDSIKVLNTFNLINQHNYIWLSIDIGNNNYEVDKIVVFESIKTKHYHIGYIYNVDKLAYEPKTNPNIDVCEFKNILDGLIEQYESNTECLSLGYSEFYDYYEYLPYCNYEIKFRLEDETIFTCEFDYSDDSEKGINYNGLLIYLVNFCGFNYDFNEVFS